MFSFFKYHKFLYGFFVITILTNCQLKKSTNPHGILFLENRTNKLIVNQSNKNDVINIIGQPHSKSIEDDNEWIYIERIFEKGKLYKLGKNILKTNNVLFLKFDKYGILENKKLFNKDDINKVAFSNKETENDLTKSSFVEGFLSSLRAKMYGKK